MSNVEIHKCLVWGIPLPFQTLEENEFSSQILLWGKKGK